MANEARSINANSPNHLVETGNSSQTFAGKAAFSHQVINESGLRFLMAHHENGITRFNVEGTLQVVAGDKNTENSEDVIVISQNGNIDVVSVKGHTNVHATNICIQASIKIGDNEPKSLGDALKVSNIFKAFSGSMVDIDKVLGINTKLG
jgi:hypothetical protein